MWLFGLILQRDGYSVIKVNTMAAALEIASHGAPDLFILDAMLPTGRGIELCTALRSHAETARTPIILVSNSRAADIPSTEDLRQRALRAGASDFLARLDSPTDLLKNVRKFLCEAGPGAAYQSQIPPLQ